MRSALFAAGALALALAACGQRQSAVPATDQTASTGPSGAGFAPSYSQASARDPRDLPVPKVDGKPLWAANRLHTAEENAQYQFSKNGGDFGAKSEADYVTKVHAFVDRPPAGVETLDRSNGDRLLYDAHDNVFAVVSRTGAPRTMFKPRDGATYWAEQKQRLNEPRRSEPEAGRGGADQS